MLMPFLIQKLSIKIRSAIHACRIIHSMHIHLQLRPIHCRLTGIRSAKCHRAGMVETMYHLRQMPGYPLCRFILFMHFITGTPHDNRRMVTIPADQCLYIFLMPFIEKRAIIINLNRRTVLFHINRCIIYIPCTCSKKFIHHKKPHLVRQLQQFRCRRVMGSTQRITTETL